VEWRPASSSKNDAGKVHEWTRLSERPPRVIAGEVLITKGAVEIDVDTLLGHREIVCPPLPSRHKRLIDQEYRLGVNQSNYHDWERDLRVEIKSEEKLLGVVYLIPEQDHAAYCALNGWSPISQDELAAALASKLGMSDMVPPDLPELDVGVGEEALKALLEADVGTNEDHGPPLAEPVQSSDPVLDRNVEDSLIEPVRLSASLDGCSS
jgi:hypothetical protein